MEKNTVVLDLATYKDFLETEKIIENLDNNLGDDVLEMKFASSYHDHHRIQFFSMSGEDFITQEMQRLNDSISNLKVESADKHKEYVDLMMYKGSIQQKLTTAEAHLDRIPKWIRRIFTAI